MPVLCSICEHNHCTIAAEEFHRQALPTRAIVPTFERDGETIMAELKKLEHGSGAQRVLEEAAAYQEMLQREAAMKEQILAQQALEAANHNSQIGALVETIYLVAAADGRFSSDECAELTAHVSAMTGGQFSADEIESLRCKAESFASEGIEARARAIAECVTDMDLRRSALLAASAAAWQDGGIGQKEGLALQTLARAFGIPTNELHKIMSEAHG